MMRSVKRKLSMILLLIIGLITVAGCTAETSTLEPLLTRDVLSTEEVGERMIVLPTAEPSKTTAPIEPAETPCCKVETEDAQPSATLTTPGDTTLTPTSQAFIPGGRQWSAVYRGSGDATGLAIVETRSGDYLILGKYAEGAGASKPWLLQLAPDGTIIWQQTFTDILQSEIYPMTDGGFLLIGNGSLVNFGSDGSIRWQNTYSRSGGQITYPPIGSVVEVNPEPDGGAIFLSEGGVISRVNRGGVMEWQELLQGAWNSSAPVAWMLQDAGLAAGQQGVNGFWVQRNGSASPSWTQTIIFSEEDVQTRTPLLIRGMRDGGLLFVGPVLANSRLEGTDLYLSRFNRSGDILWHHIVQGGEESDLNAIETRDGGMLITAITTLELAEESTPKTYLRIIRLNTAGTLLWDQLFGNGDIRIDINDIIQSRDGGFMMLGQLDEPIPGQDGDVGGLFVLKVDRNGTIPGCDWTLDNPLKEYIVPSPFVELQPQDDFPRFQGELEVDLVGIRIIELQATDAQAWQVCVYPNP